MSKIVNELKSYLSQNTNNIFTVCLNALRFIDEKEAAYRTEYLTTFLSELSPHDLSEDLDRTFFQTEEIPEETQKELFNLKNQIVKNLVQKKVTEQDFYKEIWNKLNDELLIPNEESRAIFLSFLWSDNRVPYYLLDDGFTMSDEEYKKVVQKLEPTLSKANYILNSNFNYKTQTSSLLLQLSNNLDNDTERTVFWAVLLGRLKHKVAALSKELVDIHKQIESTAE